MSSTRLRILILLLLSFASLLSTANASWAELVVPPPDLLPGEPYRLVFTTSTDRDALSSDIADYDAFVSSVAAKTTLKLLGTNWRALASTSAVDARDHTGTNPNVSTGVPIYTTAGTKLADDNAGLWDGFLDNPPISTERGMTRGTVVWTGTNADGTSASAGLGEAANSVIGINGETGPAWISAFSGPTSQTFAFYAISDVLIAGDPLPAVPALGAWAVAALAAILASLGAARARRSS